LLVADLLFVFFFSSRRRHTRSKRDWSSDVCSSDLTGCFMLMNIGNTPSPSAAGLITTATASTVLRPQYALEGSVFVGGAVVQWLRDKLGAIESSQHVESLTEAVDDAGGVIMVPAFTGLGAPYWQPQARGSILGISRGTTMAHIAYAALE